MLTPSWVDRLVDCQSLRKALEAFYSTLLPKGGCHPFVYLSLLIDAHRLDVNVHPTKHEVVFENEEEIIQEVIAAVSTNLAEQASSRRFTSTQAQSSPQPSTHRASSNAAQHQAEGERLIS